MKRYFVLETLTENEIDASLDLKIREHLKRCFPESPEKFQQVRVWHNTSPKFTVIYRDTSGRVLGHVAMVVRTITTTWNWRYNVASLQGVSVDEECRGGGLAQQLVVRVLEEAKQEGYLYAILFCREPLVAFYQKMGWRLADDSVVMRNMEDNPITMKSNCPMYKELTGAPFPEGPVDVHNPERVGM